MHLQTLRLLEPSDPPAFSIRNPDGGGPGIILCDHASNLVPSRLDHLGLPDSALAKHIAYDIGAQGMAEIISDRLDIPALIGGYSRLVIDLNRPPEDYTSIREIYDGAIVPANRAMDTAERAARRSELFDPYHAAAVAMIERKCEMFPVPAIISVHSCTDEYRGEFRPWHIGVLSHRDRRLAERVLYDGAIVPANRAMDTAERAARRSELFDPYHAAAVAMIERKCELFPVPAIISVHSCTDEYRGEFRPWHIGVLSHRDRRLAERVLQRLSAHRPDLTIGDNKPYSGLDPYGYSIETHALPQGRPNVTFEVRQDLIGDAEGQNEFGGLLATVLEEVLGDPSLFTRFSV